MFSLFNSKPSYTPISGADYHDEETKAGEPRPQSLALYHPKSSRLSTWGWILVITVLAGLSATWTLVIVKTTTIKTCSSPKEETSNGQAARPCLQPSIRREWRTLARADRNAYIAAVQCLATKPSKLYANGSLYDDFPRTHQATAPTAHRAAPFLPWHRYFVHAYESALKQDCGYAGAIP
jgi:hypothetical protein